MIRRLRRLRLLLLAGKRGTAISAMVDRAEMGLWFRQLLSGRLDPEPTERVTGAARWP